MRFLTLLAFLVPALTLLACSPNVETRGALKDSDWQTRITPDKTTRDDVLEALGTPSARASFGPETWYYITTRRESFAFLKPEVADQEVVKVSFHPDGTVEKVEKIGKDQAKDVAFSDRVTPTEGHQLTFMEQLLGNLGRFNAPAGVAGSPSTSRRQK